MPFPSEHAARVREPELFQEDTMRRSGVAVGIDIIAGKLIETPLDGDPDAMTAQSYRFDAEVFTPDQAKDWLEENDIEYILFEEAVMDEEAAEPDDNEDDKNNKNTNPKPVYDEDDAKYAQLKLKLGSLISKIGNGNYRAECRLRSALIPSTIKARTGTISAVEGEPIPSTDGIIRKDFRLVSGDIIICDSNGMYTMIPGDVLERDVAMFSMRRDVRGREIPIPLRLDHSRDADRIVGQAGNARFSPATDEVPPGIDGTIEVDPELDPKVAKLVDKNLINAVSACWEQEWAPSHPKMGFWEFMFSMGEVVDDEIVCMKATKISNVREISLVDFGADPFALEAKSKQEDEAMFKELVVQMAEAVGLDKNATKAQIVEAMQSASKSVERLLAAAEKTDVTEACAYIMALRNDSVPKSQLLAMKSDFDTYRQDTILKFAVHDGKITPNEAKSMAPWAKADPDSFNAFIQNRKAVPVGVQFRDDVATGEAPSEHVEDDINSNVSVDGQKADRKSLEVLAGRMGMTVDQMINLSKVNKK